MSIVLLAVVAGCGSADRSELLLVGRGEDRTSSVCSDDLPGGALGSIPQGASGVIDPSDVGCRIEFTAFELETDDGRRAMRGAGVMLWDARTSGDDQECGGRTWRLASGVRLGGVAVSDPRPHLDVEDGASYVLDVEAIVRVGELCTESRGRWTVAPDSSPSSLGNAGTYTATYDGLQTTYRLVGE